MLLLRTIFLLSVPLLILSANASPINGGADFNLEVQLEKRAPYFYKGHDLSSLGITEAQGYNYQDIQQNYEVRPAEEILSNGGANTVRLRLWVADKGQYNKTYTLALAKRFAGKGQRIFLNMHLSDTWADPGHNNVPAGWPKDLPGLSWTLQHFGNEIRHGMLWPTGWADPWIKDISARAESFDKFASLWTAARKGVTEAVGKGVPYSQVMIHIDNGWDKTMQSMWFEGLIQTGKVGTEDFDIIGLSFYPYYGVRATFNNFADTLDTLAKTYNKSVMVVETNWPVYCSGKNGSVPDMSEKNVPFSTAGQRQWVRGHPRRPGPSPQPPRTGIVHWEPAWITNAGLGSKCEDNILFTPQGVSRDSCEMFLP
ncbi:glycoside hydrolase superfamily [Powellomyces hirtus]|nr:glycoside hydrolase superfamily [Powellomyces hirtus]